MIQTAEIDNLSRQEIEELLQITEKWSTDEENKFHLYIPNPVMLHFHNSPAKTRALFGGNRSGKTHALMIELAAQFLGKSPESISIPPHRLNPRRKNRLCTIDYPNNFVKVIQPYIEKFIPDSSVAQTIREQGRIKAIINHHGGLLEFMQYEQSVVKFQGSSRDTIAYDEEPPKSIRDENLARLIDTDGEEIFSLTPVSEIDKPVLWIADEIYYKTSRTVEMIDGILSDVRNPLGNPNIECFFANIYDNSAISKEAADRILSSYPEEERLVRQKGHFMFMSGRVYKYFNDSHHLIEPFEWWKRPYSLYIALDTHPRTPTAVLFMIVDEKGTKYCVDEMFMNLNDMNKFIDEYKAKCHNIRPERVIIEPAAFIPDPVTGSCLAYELMKRGLNSPGPTPAPKALSTGIIRTNDAFRIENGKSELYVFKSCTRFRYEITHYVWDSWKKDTGVTKELKQKPIDKDDHLMECLYRLMLIEPKFVIHDEEENSRYYKPKTNKGYPYGGH